MICPKCGWELRELKLKAQYCSDVFTCDNGVCVYCNVVFTLHVRIVGVLVMSGEGTSVQFTPEIVDAIKHTCCLKLMRAMRARRFAWDEKGQTGHKYRRKARPVGLRQCRV
jgi:hypothetical protein